MQNVACDIMPRKLMRIFEGGEIMQEYNELAETSRTETDTTETTPLQPMGFIDILGGVFSAYRNHFGLLFAIAAVHLVAFFLRDLVVAYFIRSPLPIVLMITGFTSVAVGIILLLVNAGLIFVGAHIYLGRKITVEAALQRAGQRFWSYLGSTILCFLVVTGLSITIIGIPFAIYFSVRWALYGQPLLLEDATATQSLRRSTELVRNSWWRVFGILIGVYLISFMIYFILEAFSGLFLSGMGIAEIQSEEATGFIDAIFDNLFSPAPSEVAWFPYIVRSFVEGSMFALTLPIGVISSTLLYFDLRIRKEGYGRETETDRMSSEFHSGRETETTEITHG